MDNKVNQIFVDAYNNGFRYMLINKNLFPLVFEIMQVFSYYIAQDGLILSLKNDKILANNKKYIELFKDVPNKKGVLIWWKDA